MLVCGLDIITLEIRDYLNRYLEIGYSIKG
jgi:hypothetical protein